MLALFEIDRDALAYECTLLDLIKESENTVDTSPALTSAPAINDFSAPAEQWRYENGQRVCNRGKVIRRFDRERCLILHTIYGDTHDETNAHGACQTCGAIEADYAPAAAAAPVESDPLEIVKVDGTGGGVCVFCGGICDYRWDLTRRNGECLAACSECKSAVQSDPAMVPVSSTIGHLTFAVFHADGSVSVRSSKTMAYMRALEITDAKGPGIFSWHQTQDAAAKAFGTAIRNRTHWGQWQVQPVRAYPYSSQRAKDLRAAARG